MAMAYAPFGARAAFAARAPARRAVTGPSGAAGAAPCRVAAAPRRAARAGRVQVAAVAEAASVTAPTPARSVNVVRPDLTQRVPAELLRAATPEGQAAREGALKGAVILFVCAGYGKKSFIYEKARALGATAVLVDSFNHWGKDAVGSAFDAFYGVDLSRDTDSVLADIEGVYAQVVEKYGAVHGIASFSDLAQPLVARLCARLGYPANSVDAVARARNKDLTRIALHEAGLPTPVHMLIQRPDQLADAASKVGFPSVLKPIGGSESIGVVRVDSPEDLAQRYGELQSVLRATAYKDGNLSTFDDESDTEGSANSALEFFTDLMLEQYMDGPEVDVDIVLSDGEVVSANVVDNGPTYEPWFQETNTNSPSLKSPQQQRELIDMAAASLKALGLVHGVHHTELKYTSRGARLLEVNPRMGGRGVHTINLLSTGVCLVTEHLLAVCGLPCAPPRSPEPVACIGEYGVIAPRSGVLADHAFIQKWESHPDIVYCRPLAPVGAKLTGANDGFPTWIAEVMVRKPTAQEAIKLVTEIHDDMISSVNITPPAPAAAAASA